MKLQVFLLQKFILIYYISLSRFKIAFRFTSKRLSEF